MNHLLDNRASDQEKTYEKKNLRFIMRDKNKYGVDNKRSMNRNSENCERVGNPGSFVD